MGSRYEVRGLGAYRVADDKLILVGRMFRFDLVAFLLSAAQVWNEN